MSSKPKLPGVDEKALAALARQFPSNSVSANPSQPPAAPETSPPVTDPAAKMSGSAGNPVNTPAQALPATPAVSGDPAKPTAGDQMKPLTSDLVKPPVIDPAKPTAIDPVKPPAGDPVQPRPAIADPAKAQAAGLGAAPTASATVDPVKPVEPTVKMTEPTKTVPPLGASPKAPVEPPAPRPTPAPVKRASRGGRVLATLALLAALVALVIAAPLVMPYWTIQWVKDQTGSPAIVDFFTERRDGIEARLAADAAARQQVEAQLNAGMARIGAIEAVGGSSQAAATRVDALEAAVKELTARLATSEETTRAMQARIGELESGAKAAGERIAAADESNRRALGELTAGLEALKKIDHRAERLYLASLQLRSATQGSGRFAKELGMISPLVGTSEEMRASLRVLAARAETGVPTVAELRATFARSVLPRLTANAPAARDSAIDRGVAWINSWFASSRPAAAPRGGRNAAAIALAERHLNDGQLAAAVDQLLLLEDSAALIVAEWLREANARLATDRATAAIAAQAFEQLSAAP